MVSIKAFVLSLDLRESFGWQRQEIYGAFPRPKLGKPKLQMEKLRFKEHKELFCFVFESHEAILGGYSWLYTQE